MPGGFSFFGFGVLGVREEEPSLLDFFGVGNAKSSSDDCFLLLDFLPLPFLLEPVVVVVEEDDADDDDDDDAVAVVVVAVPTCSSSSLKAPDSIRFLTISL